jgi:hypothetical protein
MPQYNVSMIIEEKKLITRTVEVSAESEEKAFLAAQKKLGFPIVVKQSASEIQPLVSPVKDGQTIWVLRDNVLLSAQISFSRLIADADDWQEPIFYIQTNNPEIDRLVYLTESNGFWDEQVFLSREEITNHYNTLLKQAGLKTCQA